MYVSAQGAKLNNSVSSFANAGLSITSGNTIIVGVSSTSALGSPTIADTAANSWTAYSGNPYAPGGTGGSNLYAWWCTNCNGNASDIVTISFTFASVIAGMVVAQFSGLNTVIGSLLDGSPVTAQDASTTSSHSTGSITTAQANDDIVALITEAFGNSAITMAAAGSWQLPAAAWVNGSPGNNMGIQYQSGVSTGSHTNTWTTTGDSGSLKGQSIILALTPASGGGPPATYAIESENYFITKFGKDSRATWREAICRKRFYDACRTGASLNLAA